MSADTGDVRHVDRLYEECVALERAALRRVLHSDHVRDVNHIGGQVDGALDFAIHKIRIGLAVHADQHND